MSKIPTNLQEAFDLLDEMVSDSEIQEIQGMSLNTFVGGTHQGIGRWLRNNWDLWKGEGPLYHYFVELGLEHADDMSGFLLTSYWRSKKGEDIDIKEQVEDYQRYWRASMPKQFTVPPDREDENED